MFDNLFGLWFMAPWRGLCHGASVVTARISASVVDGSVCASPALPSATLRLVAEVTMKLVAHVEVVMDQ